MYEDLTILIAPHPTLKISALPLQWVTSETRELAVRMLELMYDKGGMGLAAPQVGILRQLIVVNHTGRKSETESELVIVNPLICKRFDGTEKEVEGCLSFPRHSVQVRRHKKIKLHGYMLGGEEIDSTFVGPVARVIQHECDHLNSITIVDKETQDPWNL